MVLNGDYIERDGIRVCHPDKLSCEVGGLPSARICDVVGEDH